MVMVGGAAVRHPMSLSACPPSPRAVETDASSRGRQTRAKQGRGVCGWIPETTVPADFLTNCGSADSGCACRGRARDCVLAEFDPGQARGDPRRPRRVLEDERGQRRVEPLPEEHGATGHLRHVRQAFVPGVFFGLNLATFFSGATHNSVANAALIGSLSPFLIVPLGAVLFQEYFNPRALVFALVAFGGAVIVLFSAPPNGDASLLGQRRSGSWRCCCGPATSSRRGTSAATWTWRPSWRRSARSRRCRFSRWRSPTGMCSG